jgi:hypothetical protein
LESARHATEWNERKIAALTAFAAAEAAFLKTLAPPSAPGLVALALLSAALPLGVLAFSPLTGKPRWHPFQAPPQDKPRAADRLVSVEDLAQYTQAELIARLDWYLGGGITATQYYEDLVGQTLIYARLATRKQSLFWTSCFLVGAAQLCLAGLMLWR